MDPMQALDTTSQHFIALVGQVGAEQWDAPTPCEQWNVRSLVGHVITSTQGYAELLRGAPASRLGELGAQKSTIGGNDVLTAVIQAAA